MGEVGGVEAAQMRLENLAVDELPVRVGKVIRCRLQAPLGMGTHAMS